MTDTAEHHLHDARAFRAAATLASAECYALLCTTTEGSKARAAAEVRVAAADDLLVMAARLVRTKMAQVREAEAAAVALRRERIAGTIRLVLSQGPTSRQELIGATMCPRSKVMTILYEMASRGEVCQGPNRLYMLDGEKERQERVLEQVRAHDAWRSTRALAKASCVGTRVVEEMVSDGLICRRPDGEAGFIAVE